MKEFDDMIASLRAVRADVGTKPMGKDFCLAKFIAWFPRVVLVDTP